MGIAGLTFGARILKIDDNGYVTFTLSPAISSPSEQRTIENCGTIDLLNTRRLDTGSIRVKDGNTLILKILLIQMKLKQLESSQSWEIFLYLDSYLGRHLPPKNKES